MLYVRRELMKKHVCITNAAITIVQAGLMP